MTNDINPTVNLRNRPNRRPASDGGQENFQKIDQPKPKKNNNHIITSLVLFVVIVIIGFGGYWLVLKKEVNQTAKIVDLKANWYAIKLVNGEMFYGQILDTSPDPVVVKNVYYDYDQQTKGGSQEENQVGLRLVKRGKEAHGPSGTLNLVRSQILYMEPLVEDSKVLEAILDYEVQNVGF